LARAGHQVTIAEAEDEFGGRSLKESGLVGLSAWRRVRDYRVYQLQQRDNVTLYPANKLSAEDIKEFGADQVIIAMGSNWRNDGVGSMNFAPLPWLSEVNVLTPDDVMSESKPVTGKVVVYDDEHNYMGSVMAEELRKQGHSVTLVTPHREVAAWTDYTLEIDKILNRLAELEIPVHPDYQLQNGNDTQLNFEYLRPAGKDLILDCDTLVFVGARLPKDELYLELQRSMPAKSIHLVGDALVPGIIQAAVFSGHKTARSILAAVNGEKAFFRLDRPDI
jgi:dimethylamine/trimethylamine dehydrogenase